MSSQQPIILTVHPKGTPEHERFVISDQHGRFWTGTTWDTCEDNAELFHSHSKAAEKIHQLLVLEFIDLPVRHFTASVHISLFSEKDISLRDLSTWLHKVVRLYVGDGATLPGPIEGALGLCQINWAELKEL